MSDFSIPMDIMDNYIFKADPVYAIVYLYIYKITSDGRMAPDNKTVAEVLNLQEKDVEEALLYWKQKGFRITSPVPPKVDKSTYTPNDYANNKEFSFVCESVEKSLGKILSSNDSQTLFWIYDYLGFTPTVILMIVNYALRENKANMRYIEKIATGWADKGLYSPQDVEKHLAEINEYRTYEKKIKNKLGVSGREFTPSEKKIIRSWETEIKPTEKELVSALEICIERTGRLSLKYINGILSKWRNPKEKRQSAQKSKYGNFNNRTDIDYDKIEIDALRKRINKG